MSLSNKLTGIELGNNALEHLVTDRGQDALVIVQAELLIDMRKTGLLGSREDTQGDVDHLQVLAAGRRLD